MHKVNPDAWSEYARGRQLCTSIFTGRVENLPPDQASSKALEILDASIRLDPEFAPAYAAKAACAWSRLLVGFDVPAQHAPQTRTAALRAVSLDRSLGEPYAVLGAIKRDYDWDWEGAEADFLKGLSVEPGSAMIHTQYAVLLDAMGRFEEGIKEAVRGAELDPASPMSGIVVPYSTLAASDFELAAKQFRTVANKKENAGPAYAQLTWVLHKLGRTDEAAEAWRQARQFYPACTDHLWDTWLLEETVQQQGRPEAVKIVQHWELEAKHRYVDPYNLAAMNLALGNEAAAFDHLRQALRERSPGMYFLKVEPWFLSIRDRPAYREILRTMNLL